MNSIINKEINSIIKIAKIFFWLNLILGIIMGIGAIITNINHGFAVIVLMNAMVFNSVFIRLQKYNQKKEKKLN